VNAPRNCPHCGGRLTAHHLRDTGEIPLADAIAYGYCPTLAAKRNHQTATLTELVPA